MKIDALAQLKHDFTGLGSVAIYNLIRKTVSKYIPKMANKELIVSVASYILIVLKGKKFIANAGFDAVRIEALGNAIQALSKIIPILKTFSPFLNPLIEGDDTYIEGDDDMDDIYTIEGIDEDGEFTIEGDGNDNYIESF